MDKVGAVVVAAGGGSRMRGSEKIFAEIDGHPLLFYPVETLQRSSLVSEIVIVLGDSRLDSGRELVKKYGWSKVTSVCAGGARRQDSVREGLSRLSQPSWVLIHDGARPCLTNDIIERGLEAARESGAAIPAIPVTDTIKRVSPDEYVIETPPRPSLWAVQTPQVFRSDIIFEACNTIDDDVTDDAAMVERLGHRVKIFQGSYENIKVTTPQDLIVAETIIKARARGNH